MTDTERIDRLERAVKNVIVMAVFDRVRSEPETDPDRQRAVLELSGLYRDLAAE
jgi:hypothetical protein